MRKWPFLNLNKGDCIYIYSGGKLEGTGRLAGQGRYICVVEDKNEAFLCWRKHNGNEVYTNLNGISVEMMNENTAHLENTRETCERGYVDNQNTDNTYNQSYNNYDQNMDTTYQPNYDTYNQNANGMYDDTYYPNNDSYNQNNTDTYDSGYNSNQNTNYNYDQEYNTYDQNMENTYDQSYENYNPETNNYNQYPNDMYDQEYNQNSGCTCKQCYNQNYPK
ncbi:hypothetical protein ACQKFK_32590 [Bacillus mycoides]|uniref:hypothetical protein n=1 Tax=Bacillus mycoides TaxID=1405 RepID=UPI003D0476A9